MKCPVLGHSLPINHSLLLKHRIRHLGVVDPRRQDVGPDVIRHEHGGEDLRHVHDCRFAGTVGEIAEWDPAPGSCAAERDDLQTNRGIGRLICRVKKGEEGCDAEMDPVRFTA